MACEWYELLNRITRPDKFKHDVYLLERAFRNAMCNQGDEANIYWCCCQFIKRDENLIIYHWFKGVLRVDILEKVHPGINNVSQIYFTMLSLVLRKQQKYETWKNGNPPLSFHPRTHDSATPACCFHSFFSLNKNYSTFGDHSLRLYFFII